MPVDLADVIVRCWSVTTVVVLRKSPPSKWKMRVLPPPSSVICPPPSMVVSLPLGSSICAVMDGRWPPQLKVTMPPAFTAASRSASVHVPAPVPTTVVGVVASTAVIGGVHVVGGAAPSRGLSPPAPRLPPSRRWSHSIPAAGPSRSRRRCAPRWSPPHRVSSFVSAESAAGVRRPRTRLGSEDVPHPSPSRGAHGVAGYRRYLSRFARKAATSADAMRDEVVERRARAERV